MVLLRAWVLRIAYYLFYPSPVREKVVFASMTSDRLDGNLRFLRDELVRQRPDVQIVLLLHRPSSGLLGRARTLGAALRAEYHLATARVFVVDDYYFPIYIIRPKRETTIIQAWHASGAFKRFGYSVVGKEFGASAALVRHVDIHSNYDHCLIGSESALPHYAEAFGQPAERFATLGIPRTDPLVDEAWLDEARERVARSYALPAGKKTLLYAPTFRGAVTHSAVFDEGLDLSEMSDVLADEYVLLLRQHPLIAERWEIDGSLAGFVIDVSAHEDVNELLAASDVLVTDYSSVIFEFSLLVRPMLFFAPDFEQYGRERGLYVDYETWVPGPVFTDTREAAEYVARGAFDAERVRSFARDAFAVADGHASRRVVDELIVANLR